MISHSRPIGIDLFAGAGGLSLGFEQAGFEVAAAVEVDPIHACVHKYNFPKCTVIPKSIVDVTGNEIREKANLVGKKISIVFGGPPCQGFSLIGQRALDDPRNSLVKDFVRIVHELEADYFVFENVKGLTLGKHRKFLIELINAFNNIGYDITSPWLVLNAANYNVPQNRERLFLLGFKKGLQAPKYPQAVTKKNINDSLPLPLAPTCKEALADLPDAELFEELENNDEVLVTKWGRASDYAKKLRCTTKKSWAFGHQRKWDKNKLTSSMRTNHTEISRNRFRLTEKGSVEPISRFFKLTDNGLSNTLRAGTDASRGAFTSPRPIHYAHSRCVTVREMARLHGFPDWFRFHETKWHGARQIGNAVPPPLAKSVAAEICKAMSYSPSSSKLSFTLKDDFLLRMDMTKASNYWDIPIPIGKRDRKSDLKKRKQTQSDMNTIKKKRAV